MMASLPQPKLLPGILLPAPYHRKESTLPAADFRNGKCAFYRGCGRLFEEVAALPPFVRL